MVFDLGVGRVCLDRLNALLGACLRLVTLAGSDDLAVRGLEVEPKLTRMILTDLELGRQRVSPLDWIEPGGLTGITLTQLGEQLQESPVLKGFASTLPRRVRFSTRRSYMNFTSHRLLERLPERSLEHATHTTLGRACNSAVAFARCGLGW